jgi:hypothetical protein
MVNDFLGSELSPQSSGPLVETNLATIIGILAKEDLSGKPGSNKAIPFNLDDKLIFNNLKAAVAVIEEYKIHHGRIDRIYSEFDVAGKNKSKSVLDSFRSSYVRLSSNYSADELFFQVVDQAIRAVQQSANYIPIPLEELELYVNVIAVDAFIRCRIFKNPEVTENAAA